MNGSERDRRGIGGTRHWLWDATVVLVPGSLGTIRLWISEGAPTALAFLAIIGAVAVCIVIARRWGRHAQLAVMLVVTITSMAWLLAIVA